MIDITTQVSGGQIADALAGDDEECARCLDRLSDEMSERAVKELAQCIVDYADAERLTAWLLSLARAIKEASA